MVLVRCVSELEAMIDSLTENLISLAEAARLCPRRRANRPAHVSCIYRWTDSGCRGVVLESIQVGGTRCTSREAVKRFFDRLTALSEIQPVTVPASKPRRRQAQIEAAERRLEASGIR